MITVEIAPNTPGSRLWTVNARENGGNTILVVQGTKPVVLAALAEMINGWRV